jgi:hypothetical protein
MLKIVAATAAVAGLLSACGQSETPAEKYDYPAKDLGKVGERTAAGTKLSFGEPAWLDGKADLWTEKIDGLVGATPLEVYALDKTYWEKFSNYEDFKNKTPYVLVAQFSYAGAPQGDEVPADLPKLLLAYPDGKPTEYLAGNFGMGGVSFDQESCDGAKVPEWEGKDGDQQYVACALFSVADGKKPTQVLYTSQEGGMSEGLPYSNETSAMYAKKPVVWPIEG